MNEARTYTLAEARRVMALDQCAAHGHEWDIIQSHAAGALRIVCASCGWSGTVAMGERPSRP